MLKYICIFGIFINFTEALFSRNAHFPNFTCDESETYRQNHCGTCFCFKGKIVSCNRMRCTGLYYYKSRICNTAEKWTEGCNDCWCTLEYGTICTVRDCTSNKACPKCPSCPPCKCQPCSGNDDVGAGFVEEPNPSCTYPPDEDYDYYSAVADDHSCPKCKSCPTCECPECPNNLDYDLKPSVEVSENDTKTPPDDVEISSSPRPGNHSQEQEEEQEEHSKESEEVNLSQCKLPEEEDDYDYYDDKEPF